MSSPQHGSNDHQTPGNLEERIQSFGDALTMLRSSHAGYPTFPFKNEFTNWRDEQSAWTQSATLFNQGEHMTEVTFDGPDLIPLLSHTGIGTLDNFGEGRAKQFVAVNSDGYVIGDGILFGLAKNRATLVGAVPSRWVEHQAELGGFDVQITRDDWSGINKQRRHFRYQVQGPNALEVVARAADGNLPDIPFFRIGELKIDGVRTHALSHSMTRRPGLELWGERADGPRVLAKLLEAGEEYGMVQGGAMAYSTTGLESGWWGMYLPGVYTQEMQAYRYRVPLNTLEAGGSLGGSFYSERIEDYYMTPWDLGFGKLVSFDHEFIGKDALQAKASESHRHKVWLRWNDDDVAAITRDSLFEPTESRPKSLRMPNPVDSTFPADAVLHGGSTIGISGRVGYTTNVGHVFSLATVDTPFAVDGTDVEVIWGDSSEAPARFGIERHTARPVRAKVATKRLA